METGNLCVLRPWATVVSADTTKPRLCCVWWGRGGYLGADCAQPHPGHGRRWDVGTGRGLWGTTCFLEIAGRDPSSPSLPQHVFPALGFEPVRRAWLEEEEFQRCPWSVWSCVSNVCRAAGLPSPSAVLTGREKGTRTPRMGLGWGRCWEQVAKREGQVKLDGESSL